MKKNEIYSLTIDALSNDGNGVARTDEGVVFVPFTAPGDRAEIKIVKAGKSLCYGRVEQITRPSPQRVESDCAAFGRCGGCSFRHIDYKHERAAKRQFVEDAIRRIGGLDARVLDTVPSPDVCGYRNKAQFPVFSDGGRACFGLYSMRSHRPVRVDGCRIQPGIFTEIAAFVCAQMDALGITVYDETALEGEVRHICLRSSSDGSVQLCLVINADSLTQGAALARAVMDRFPCVKGVLSNTNKRPGNAILGKTTRVVAGEAELRDTLAGVPVYLSPGAFFQVNRGAAHLLYKRIAELAGEGGTLLDLYCGAGTIGLSLADRFSRIIGVEAVPDAVKSARRAAREMGLSRCVFRTLDAAQAAEMLVKRVETIDVAVVDPPRKGCSPDALDALVSLSPRRIVMVSCNPATLARDLKFLTGAGYAAGDVTPVDMFPRTPHVEAVVMMSKTKCQ